MARILEMSVYDLFIDPKRSGFRQGHPALTLIFATSITVTGLTHFIALEKEHLCAPFACVDLGWQGRGVAEFQGDEAFPLGFKRRHVDDDPAAGICAFA
jgi:hypothetical protein